MGIVELRNVTVDFESVRAIENINLTITAGELFVLIGPNGAGKTTILKVIAGLLKPTEGELWYRGTLVTDSLRHQVRTQAPLVFQKPVLFGTTVFKNIAYGLRIRNVKEAEVRRRVEAALELVELNHLQNRFARQLSGGEQRRTSLAMAVALDTEMILLDEPTAYLDPENTKIIESTLRYLNKEKNTTIIVVTHNMLQTELLADRAALVQYGHIERIGYVREIFRTELEGLLSSNQSVNTFKGVAQAIGPKTFGGQLVNIRLTDSVSIEAISNREGVLTIMIPPEDIIVSTHQILSSAKNVLQGRITHIQQHPSTAMLTIDVGVELTAQITTASLNQLSINLGDQVHVTFKASSVRVY